MLSMGVHKLFFIKERMTDFGQQAEKIICSKYMIYIYIYMINRLSIKKIKLSYLEPLIFIKYKYNNRKLKMKKKV